MSRWWHYAVEAVALAFFAVTAAAAAPVVVASEAGFFLADVAMTVGEAEGILTTSMAGGALAASAIVSQAVSDFTGSKKRGRNLTDPFDSPQPTEEEDIDEDVDEGLEVDQPIITRSPGLKNEHPLVPISGDYAGIQKTMYNPVTGSIIGLKMHARSSRGIFGGNFHTVKNILSRSRGVPVKVTHHSPVSVFGFPSS
jgi:hypothetical protein